MSQSILYNKSLNSDIPGLEIKIYKRKLRIYYAILGVLIFVLLIICISLVFLFGVFNKTPSSSASTLTEIKCGWIKGKLNNGVVEYLGIPYAYPPIGSRRFVHAQYIFDGKDCNSIYGDKKTPYEATHYKSSCVQYDKTSKTLMGNEDCLYLNIYIPSGNAIRKLPVIFVISSVFFASGSGNMSGLIVLPEVVKMTNAIHVTFNHRLGPMNSIINPVTNETNHGLSDVLLALKWTQKNVALFGGDPSNIILYGVGSGSSIALALYNSNNAANLFSKIWISNPVTLITTKFEDALQSQKTHLIDEKELKLFQKKLKLEKIFKNWTWSNIEQILAHKWFQFPTSNNSISLDNNIHFLLIDNDLIKGSSLLEKTIMNRNVPIVIGNNANEVDIFPFPEFVRYWEMEYFKDFMKSKMTTHFKTLTEQNLETFLQRYVKDQRMTPEDIYTKMVTDIRITCPLNSLLKKMMGFSNRQPIYRYILDDKHKYFDYFDMKYSNILAAHGWDNILYFRGYKTHSDYGVYGNNEETMSNILNKAMYDFAWTDEVKNMTVSEDGNIIMNLIRDGKITSKCDMKTTECSLWNTQLGDVEKFMWYV